MFDKELLQIDSDAKAESQRYLSYSGQYKKVVIKIKKENDA
jgi:hypothetical protein